MKLKLNLLLIPSVSEIYFIRDYSPLYFRKPCLRDNSVLPCVIENQRSNVRPPEVEKQAGDPSEYTGNRMHSFPPASNNQFLSFQHHRFVVTSFDTMMRLCRSPYFVELP